MFCRTCNYDLSGQHSSRCPECGTGFAFDDPTSFLKAPQGKFKRVGLWLRRRILLLLLTFALFASYGVAYSELPSHSQIGSGENIASTYMKRIMRAWQIQVEANPTERDFNHASAEQYLQHFYSPYSESRDAKTKAVFETSLQWAPAFIVPTIFYLLLIAFLIGKRARRRSIIAIGVLLFLLLPCAYPDVIVNPLFPGSQAFMQDVVFIPGVDITRANPNRADTITMYSVHDYPPLWRMGIGFGDGHVWWLPYDQARRLFEAHCIPFPEPSEYDSEQE